MSLKRTVYIVVPFIMLAIAYGLIVHCFFGSTSNTLIRFILTQCFVIMAPGMICTKYLFGTKEKSAVHWIGLSYALGYCINIIEYIIIWGLHLQHYAVIIALIVAVFCLFFWFYDPIEPSLETIHQDDYVLLFIFLSYLLVNVIAYSGNNISPFAGGGISGVSRDSQFWCSNAVALKNSFLPKSAFFSGAKLFYHYFSSMHVAFISTVSGIPVYDVAFTLFPFGRCILIIGALNYLIDRYEIGNLKYLFYFSIIYMTGWEAKVIVTYVSHMEYTTFGFDIGFALGGWFVALVLKLYDAGRFEIRSFIAIMLIWISLCGVKGPVAILLILIPGILCFSWLAEKRFKMAFIYGLTIIAIFSIISIECVGVIRALGHPDQTNNIMGWRSIYEVVAVTPFEARYRYFIPAMVWYGFMTQPFLFMLTVLNTAFLIWMLICKRYEIRKCMLPGTLLFTSLVGFFTGIFYIAGGRSEMYFTMAAYIPCLAYNVEMYNELLKKMKNKVMDIIYKTVLISISVLGLYCWCFSDYGGNSLLLSNGYNKIKNGENALTETYDDIIGVDRFFTRREAEACAWIRDNTAQDSVVQSNRFVTNPGTCYYVSIFTERSQYLEATDLLYYCDLGMDDMDAESEEAARRSEIIIKAFDADQEALDSMIDEGVDFFIQDNLLNEDKMKDVGLTVVYNQDGIVIYSKEKI